MRDRAMQALYLLALDPIAETTGDPNSYGFRKERSAADAIGQCYVVLGNRATADWVLEGDITSCFEDASCYSSQAPGRSSLPVRRARSRSRVAGSSGKRYSLVAGSLATAMLPL